MYLGDERSKARLIEPYEAYLQERLTTGPDLLGKQLF